MNVFDYIVIGGGSAGCVLANRLSENPKNNVLLLEAGGSDLSPAIHIPAGMAKVIANPKYDWRYPVEPDPSRCNRADKWPSGKVLGGSSSINGLFYTRGHKQDFDGWAALGNTGWSHDDLRPYFKKMENSEIGTAQTRGKDGPLHISELREVHPLSHVFVEAVHECGVPLYDDYNTSENSGVSLVQVTQKNGRRHSAASAYLAPIRARKNLKIITHALCSKLLIRDAECIGAEYTKNGVKQTVHARAEVLLSSGTIGSAKILLLSGIGPGEDLHRLGINPITDTPGVGKNLQEHPNVQVGMSVNLDTYNIAANSMFKMANYLAQWLFTRSGPATSPYSQAVTFFNSKDYKGHPDLEILFAPHRFEWSESGPKPSQLSGVNCVVCLCHPSSRGQVKLNSHHIDDSPLITLNLLSEKKDVERMIEGCRMVRRIFSTDAFGPYAGEEFAPGRDVASDEDWAEFIRQNSFGGNHLVGTCKMGTDKMAVVSPDLKVHGLKKLRVVDASVMPTLIGAHTNAATIAIAEKASDMILGRL